MVEVTHLCDPIRQMTQLLLAALVRFLLRGPTPIWDRSEEVSKVLPASQPFREQAEAVGRLAVATVVVMVVVAARGAARHFQMVVAVRRRHQMRLVLQLSDGRWRQLAAQSSKMSEILCCSLRFLGGPQQLTQCHRPPYAIRPLGGVSQRGCEMRRCVLCGRWLLLAFQVGGGSLCVRRRVSGWGGVGE